MRSKKNLVQLAVLLPILLVAISVPHASAQPGTEVAVTPGFTKNVPPTTISVAITLGPETNFVGYALHFSYNPAVITSLHVATGTWHDGLPVFTFQNTTCSGCGTIEVGQSILGPGSVSFTNQSLVVLTFQYSTFGSSPLTIDSIILSGLVNGQPAITGCFPQTSTCTAPSPTVVNGQAVTPPKVSGTLIKWKNKPDHHHLSITHDGNVQTLFAILENTGTNDMFARLDYTVVAGAGGGVTSVSTVPFLVPVSMPTAIIGVGYTVPSLPLRYFVFVDLQISGDNLFYATSGSTNTLSYAVVP